MMNATIELCGKPVEVAVSAAAEQALQARTAALSVEMELYFSCLIRKKVRFRERMDMASSQMVNDKLMVGFRPVMTRACGNDFAGDEPPLTDFPIEKIEPYVPHWLHIDFRDGQWMGEFGYQS